MIFTSGKLGYDAAKLRNDNEGSTVKTAVIRIEVCTLGARLRPLFVRITASRALTLGFCAVPCVRRSWRRSQRRACRRSWTATHLCVTLLRCCWDVRR